MTKKGKFPIGAFIVLVLVIILFYSFVFSVNNYFKISHDITGFHIASVAVPKVTTSSTIPIVFSLSKRIDPKEHNITVGIESDDVYTKGSILRFTGREVTLSIHTNKRGEINHFNITLYNNATLIDSVPCSIYFQDIGQYIKDHEIEPMDLTR